MFIYQGHLVMPSICIIIFAQNQVPPGQRKSDETVTLLLLSLLTFQNTTQFSNSFLLFENFLSITLQELQN